VIVIDNASFYQTERVMRLCYEARVKLAYLVPFSTDLNLIEEFFAELKAFIKKNYETFENLPEQGRFKY
jgi:transposase